ncbi:helix-turn-helix domain-containing protein [Streptomyces sp. NPDC041068]|uniref:ArsR/SmtB family transcription factor n=1 Tax=Streptomyces sp. NPDC041068 TaxID=3155130 RepID=UPI0033F4E019
MHFSGGDLSRTRVADQPDPLWEIVLSMHQLQERARQGSGATARCASPRRRQTLRALAPLMPSRGYFPDFLTPAAASGGLDGGIDAVLSTPRRRLRSELSLLARDNALPSWTRSLADGDTGTLRSLGRALHRYHECVLGPVWQDVAARVEADRRHRTGVQCRAGTEAMLHTFRPMLRWRPSVLCAEYPVDRDVHLGGRGLLLVPSYFCRRTPVALLDEELPPVLVYPAHPPVQDPTTTPDCRLAPLLGHTRAAVLQTLQVPCTTTELAERAGVSLSSASEHAAVLRRAGLIASVRERQWVRHIVTKLGADLLTGGAPTAQP